MNSQLHDIIAVGASAGGVDALRKIVAGLPPNLSASVFIVNHVQPGFTSHLPVLLSRGPLRATSPLHGEAIVPSHIYVAAPDTHLMLEPGYMHVVRGPKENGHRPSIDTLFRSAAKAYGPRVIGVVLTGNQDCGTAGLKSIKARGGLAVVQDPSEANVPEMPESAIKQVAVDHVVSLKNMPSLIARLVDQRIADWPADVADELLEFEGDKARVAAKIVCPLCGGKLLGAGLGALQQLRCHVGHTFALDMVTAEKTEQLERALWAAVRSLKEGAAFSRRVALTLGDLQDSLDEREGIQAGQAETILRTLLALYGAGGEKTRPAAAKLSPLKD